MQKKPQKSVPDPPLEQLLRAGPESLSDADLLALILRGSDAVTTAHQVAEEYPIERLVHLPLDELRRVKGVSLESAAGLVAAVELAKRGLGMGVGSQPRIMKPSETLNLLSGIRSERREHFVCLFLNARKQLIRQETVSIGTLDSSLVHPREVFAPALECSAAAVILAHNHPSGDPSPSGQDLELTRRLIDAGLIMGIEVLDHIIVADSAWLSFKQIGEM